MCVSVRVRLFVYLCACWFLYIVNNAISIIFSVALMRPLDKKERLIEAFESWKRNGHIFEILQTG